MKVKSGIQAGGAIGIGQNNVSVQFQAAYANGQVAIAGPNVAIATQINVAVPTVVTVRVG